MKQVSDFFMYLYQDLNRRPSTIDGYRTAIVDTLGPASHHIAQSSVLHRLLPSFHMDRPKSSRNLPKWNLSVVLNELTKAHFEPMKDTDLKHLTLKTAFLLALASRKRRSEIHAWVANKVSNLGQWEKVALFPFSDLSRLSLVSYSVAKIYENSNHWAAFSLMDGRALRALTLLKVSTAALLSYNQNILTVLALSFILFRFLALHRHGLRDWGTVYGTQTGISNIHSNLLFQNLRKIDISSSLSCNPSTVWLDSAFGPTW